MTTSATPDRMTSRVSIDGHKSIMKPIKICILLPPFTGGAVDDFTGDALGKCRNLPVINNRAYLIIEFSGTDGWVCEYFKVCLDGFGF